MHGCLEMSGVWEVSDDLHNKVVAALQLLSSFFHILSATDLHRCVVNAVFHDVEVVRLLLRLDGRVGSKQGTTRLMHLLGAVCAELRSDGSTL